MIRIFLTIAAILGGTSVAAGAFATHALKDRLSERAIEIFETGARYQMYHALALLLVGLLLSQAEGQSESGRSLLTFTGCAFMAGVAIFSGSLYALSFSGIKWLGAITPLGGLAFLLGWGSLAIAAWGYK
ncbi:MAG: DUF423 domain-containing protein [Drouetiella hepatica Uher 2000/2452]|uniref:DUF423 domain-containing protein n=1 Tax=Drouetiella hepatica Uher 2000/2452 TaxID=904376 RepID=A0A951Q7Z5_9CYAN|nr:DUF423 domain-containing protein [Drouetiella hepatica Uher 2000/2452]